MTPFERQFWIADEPRHLKLVHSVDAVDQDIPRLTIEAEDAQCLVRRLRSDLCAAIESHTRKVEALALAKRRAGHG